MSYPNTGEVYDAGKYEKSGFMATVICPFSPLVIPEEAFAQSTATEQPPPNTFMVNNTAPGTTSLEQLKDNHIHPVAVQSTLQRKVHQQQRRRHSSPSSDSDTSGYLDEPSNRSDHIDTDEIDDSDDPEAVENSFHHNSLEEMLSTPKENRKITRVMKPASRGVVFKKVLFEEGRIKNMDEEMTQLRVRLEQQRTDNDETKRQLTDKESEIKNANKERDGIQESLVACNTELESLKKLDISKDGTIASLRLEKDRFVSQLEERRQESLKLRAELETVQEDLTHMRSGVSPNIIVVPKSSTVPPLHPWDLKMVDIAAVKVNPEAVRGMLYHNMPILPRDPPDAFRPKPRFSVTYPTPASYLSSVTVGLSPLHNDLLEVNSNLLLKDSNGMRGGKEAPEILAKPEIGLSVGGDHEKAIAQDLNKAENEENNAAEKVDDINADEFGLDDPAQQDPRMEVPNDQINNDEAARKDDAKEVNSV
uniref:PPC89 centrosome localisation domain-containing protein n=1 Tax=Timema genevievae TaxID=629358 RepID=A0A7R9JV88_TIMGE|nr:unnamed protein product [Timema genevievae]